LQRLAIASTAARAAKDYNIATTLQQADALQGVGSDAISACKCFATLSISVLAISLYGAGC
jgi:hypothetical protein